MFQTSHQTSKTSQPKKFSNTQPMFPNPKNKNIVREFQLFRHFFPDTRNVLNQSWSPTLKIPHIRASRSFLLFGIAINVSVSIFTYVLCRNKRYLESQFDPLNCGCIGEYWGRLRPICFLLWGCFSVRDRCFERKVTLPVGDHFGTFFVRYTNIFFCIGNSGV